MSINEEVQKRAEIMDIVNNISKRCEMFSNPLRIVILSTLLADGPSNWSKVKEQIEKLVNVPINPNTLSFHLNKLIDGKFLLKLDATEQPMYKINSEEFKKIEDLIDLNLVEYIQRENSV